MGAIEKSRPADVAKPNPGGDGVANLIGRMRGQIERALPKHLTGDRMARILLTAVRKVPDLARCTEASFASCVMDLASIGLEPNSPLGHAYLIPRYSRERQAWECTTILGYQGLIELARRSGSVRSLYAHVVREGDLFEYELGLRKALRHVPRAPISAPVTHAYAVAHLAGDADPIFEVLTRDEVELRRKRGANGPAWRTDWEAMAKKSAVRALWPWLPRSAEMAQAVELDDDGDRSVEPSSPAGYVAVNGETRGARPKVLDALEADVEPSTDSAPETAPKSAPEGASSDDFVDE